MEIIGETALWSVSTDGRSRERRCFDIRAGDACEVGDFLELSTHVARLQFRNPGYVLLFRGQRKDYRLENRRGKQFTSIMPSMFRGIDDDAGKLRKRFDMLKQAEELLVKAYQRKDWPECERLERQRIMRWSILQHYEICRTPLLDVTQSLRIAASFASNTTSGLAFVYVLGVPNISGAITASAEAGLQIVRLASVCPPEALRPHIQEGYLLGDYPEMFSHDQKQYYEDRENDFGRRLIAKFKFNPKLFWKRDPFPKIGERALYPNANDPLLKVAEAIKSKL